VSKQLEAIRKLRDLREQLRIEAKVSQLPSLKRRLWRHVDLVDEVLALLDGGDEEAKG
jgi:hypothetical protein